MRSTATCWIFCSLRSSVTRKSETPKPETGWSFLSYTNVGTATSPDSTRIGGAPLWGRAAGTHRTPPPSNTKAMRHRKTPAAPRQPCNPGKTMRMTFGTTLRTLPMQLSVRAADVVRVERERVHRFASPCALQRERANHRRENARNALHANLANLRMRRQFSSEICIGSYDHHAHRSCQFPQRQEKLLGRRHSIVTFPNEAAGFSPVKSEIHLPTPSIEYRDHHGTTPRLRGNSFQAADWRRWLGVNLRPALCRRKSHAQPGERTRP